MPPSPDTQPDVPAHLDIASLTPNRNVEEVYLLRVCQLRTTRNGKFYLHIELEDRTGRINARMWNATEALFKALDGTQFVRVSARVEVYQDSLQMIVNTIRSVRADEVNVAEFLPATTRDVDAMWTALRTLAESVTDPHLLQLLTDVLDDETFAEKFRRAPAAVTFHQPYLGGLLEHTLSVTELADIIAARYPQLDRDLLITGCVLHDIGKVDELSYDTSFDYTDRGRLIGHLIIAVGYLQERVREIEGFPPVLFDLLSHLILSHHGEYEWGSPKLPMTAEAFALHHVDNLDAKVEASTRAISAERVGEGNWTEFNRMFQRRLYRGPRQASSEEDAPVD